MERSALLARQSELVASMAELDGRSDAASVDALVALTAQLNAVRAQLAISETPAIVAPAAQARETLATLARDAGILTARGGEKTFERSGDDFFSGTADSTAGAAVVPQFDTEIERRVRTELNLLDVIPVIPMSSDKLVYFVEKPVVGTAKPVARRTGSGSEATYGKYQPIKIELERKEVAVAKVGAYVTTDEDTIQDFPQTQALIDDELRYEVQAELVRELVAPTDTPNGIASLRTGAQSVTFELSADDNANALALLDAIYDAKVAAAKNAGQPATWVALPASALALIDKYRNAHGDWPAGGPFAAGANTIWGLARVACEQLDAQDGSVDVLVGSSRKVALMNRRQLTVSVGTISDDFLGDIVRVKGSVRTALRNKRPAAIVHIHADAAA